MVDRPDRRGVQATRQSCITLVSCAAQVLSGCPLWPALAIAMAPE
jgi:hypothetical protein